MDYLGPLHVKERRKSGHVYLHVWRLELYILELVKGLSASTSVSRLFYDIPEGLRYHTPTSEITFHINLEPLLEILLTNLHVLSSVVLVN